MIVCTKSLTIPALNGGVHSGESNPLREYGGYGASQSRERFDLLLTRVVAI